MGIKIRIRRRSHPRSRTRRLVGIAVGVLPEVAMLKVRGYGPAGNVVVRCRQGHLFTTIWIPGASVKAARLGWWRFQRCPVGRHWSLVTPVRRSVLTDEEQRSADENRDIRIP